jgi:hypothetical protein
MRKGRSRATDVQLRKLAKRYGANTLRRWPHDDDLAWVMSLADYFPHFRHQSGIPRVRAHR